MPFRSINITVFVLDDQEHVVNVISALFNKEGLSNHKVFTSAEDFFEELNEDVHVAVIDYFLPGKMNGLQVCKKLLSFNPSCFIIIMSAQTDMGVVVEFINSGANRYIEKKGDYLAKLVQFTKEGIAHVRADMEFIYKLLEKQKSLTHESDANAAINR